MSRVFVKVSHLSAAPSWDGTSFDWFVFVMSHVFDWFVFIMSRVFVKVSHLSAAPSRNGTSFDWFVFVLSRVFVKVSHLSAAPAGHIYFCIYPCHTLFSHRFYESRRWLFNDDQPSRWQKAREVKRKCKKIVQQKKVKMHAYSIIILRLLFCSYTTIERRF